MALGWCVGAALAGGLSDDWFDAAKEAELDSPYLGVTRTLLRSWLVAVPLFEMGKILSVAAGSRARAEHSKDSNALASCLHQILWP